MLQSNVLRELRQASAAASAAIEGNFASIDTDLAEVIDTWPMLPEAIRRQVITLIRETGPNH